jgi:hypothetical protein
LNLIRLYYGGGITTAGLRSGKVNSLMEKFGHLHSLYYIDLDLSTLRSSFLLDRAEKARQVFRPCGGMALVLTAGPEAIICSILA